jgi:hypothetical protein
MPGSSLLSCSGIRTGLTDSLRISLGTDSIFVSRLFSITAVGRELDCTTTGAKLGWFTLRMRLSL